jgi:hypothetical protein
MSSNKIAPIVLFVYNRPWHTRQTVEALQKNEFANYSELFVFSDSAKNENVAVDVDKVRNYVRSISGFKQVTVIEREVNYGLARNIIEGVTEICNRYGRVIVLEDDLVTSPYFLTFMNQGLEKYADKSRVWHISGWNYPIAPDGLDDAFFWRVMNCWGWATWADRWQYFKKDPKNLLRTWDKAKIKQFNLDGAHDFWSQVESNYSGKLNTWAIFWYSTIFERDGLCLNPAITFVENIGHDGTGINCGESYFYTNRILTSNIKSLPCDINESELALKTIKIFCKSINGSWVKKRVTNFLKKSYRGYSCD